MSVGSARGPSRFSDHPMGTTNLVTPSSWGLHLYYAPLLGASGQANNTVATAGLWGGDITYDLVLHPTERSLLILEFFGGYDQQNTDTSVTTALGNTVIFNETAGGAYFGVTAILPLSQKWAVTASVSSSPWGFANFQLSTPALGLSASVTGSAPQWTYAAAISYKTADQWTFSLGYVWSTIAIAAVPFSTLTGGGETIGGAFCPCSASLPGFVLSAGKTF